MKSPVVLIAEDEAITALFFSRSLRLMGYTVCDPVATGEAAVASALENHPDVILMDIRLAGEMDGIEAAELITGHRPVPVIFMTGYSDEPIRTRAERLHPAAYLVKPITPGDVKPLLDDLFRNSQS